MKNKEKSDNIEAGRIVNTHGLRGEVRIVSWMDSPEVLAAFPRLYVDGREYRVDHAYVHKGSVIAALTGVGDVNAAMALKGRTVYIARADARLPEGRFFYADILGARVQGEDGAPLGTLEEVLELPGQDVYVVRGETEHLVPAVPAFILSTDIENGLVTVRLIEGM